MHRNIEYSFGWDNILRKNIRHLISYLMSVDCYDVWCMFLETSAPLRTLAAREMVEKPILGRVHNENLEIEVVKLLHKRLKSCGPALFALLDGWIKFLEKK